MPTKRTFTTPSGGQLTDEDIDRIAADVESTAYDVEQVRRRGRPAIGSGAAQLVPVRIDPELLTSLRARVARDHSSSSEVIRAALRDYLAS